MASEHQPAPEGALPAGAPDAAATEAAMTFAADLAAALHVAYLPGDEVRRRVVAAARGVGVEVEVFTLPSAVLLQPRRSDAARLARAKFSPSWDLDRLQRLVALSEEVAHRRLGLPDARRELDRIRASPRRYPWPVAVLGFGGYGAAVAARVGGGPVEILAAGLIGLLAGAIYLGTLGDPLMDLQKGFVAAAAGTFSAFLLSFVLPPFDMGRAVFSSMTLLVPAMLVTVAAHELATETAAESGVIRLVYGVVRFVMIGAGAFAAVRVWTVFAAMPAGAEATPLPVGVVALALAAGGVALAVCTQAPPSEVPWVAAAVLFAWGVQEATKLVAGGSGSPFIAAFAVALAASLYGRLPGKVTTTVVFPALMQLVPGSLGTKAVLSSLRDASLATPTTFVDVQLVALQLALGLIAGEIVVRRRGRGAAHA